MSATTVGAQTAPAHTVSTRLRTDPAFQAFTLLRIGFTVAPILFGLDKFLDWLVDWRIYLAPEINDLVPGNAHQAMLAIGVIAGTPIGVALGRVVWRLVADGLGVDIIQNCEVEDFFFRAGRIAGVETTLGTIEAEQVAITVAGHSSLLAAKAGFRLPITSYTLQAFVSEPVKPILATVVLSPVTGFYISQSDKGELVMGGGLDLYNSYSQRGNYPAIETVLASAVEMFPVFSRLKLMRHWGGIVDVVHDSSPIIGRAPVPGLYLNCGWGTGGFKAIPAGGYLLAHAMAHDAPHPIAAPFGIERFTTGALVDEAAASGIAH